MSSRRTSQKDISIRDRLLQIAKRENRDFNVILNLYYQERFLARLALSRYQKRFLLKGGLLLLALDRSSERLSGRPTKDVDLRAEGVRNDPDSLQSVFAEICAVEVPDGVIFDAERMTVERITEDSIIPSGYECYLTGHRPIRATCDNQTPDFGSELSLN